MKEILILVAILIGYFYFFSKKTETPTQDEKPTEEKKGKTSKIVQENAK